MRPLHAFAALTILLFVSFLTVFGCTKSVHVYGPFAAVGNPGGRPVGAPCAFDKQCATNRCSADVVAGTCGQCVTIVALGQDCTGPTQGCSISAVCQDGICKSRRKVEGETCSLSPKGGSDLGECDVELFCARTDELRRQATCTRRRSLGESCADQLHGCALGTRCHVYDGCIARIEGSCPESHSCTGETYCGDDHVCHSGTLPQNAPCPEFDAKFHKINTCGSGLACGNLEYPSGGGGIGTRTTCLPLPGKGEPCIWGQCAEGLFCFESPNDNMHRYCDSPRSEGEVCNYMDEACGPGLECRANRCRAACE